MLSHYYQPDLTDEEGRLAMTDWLDALSDVPKAAVEQAIRERIRSDERARPLPGEIRKRALARIEKPGPDRTGEAQRLTEAEIAERQERNREVLVKLADEFPDFLHPDGTPKPVKIKRFGTIGAES